MVGDPAPLALPPTGSAVDHFSLVVGTPGPPAPPPRILSKNLSFFKTYKNSYI
jgi:hypothetical protein